MITVLSMGAGVQSSTLALMAAHGEVTPMPDVAIFADTGYEPKEVYDWLEFLKTKLPFPVVTVSKGNIKKDNENGLVAKKRTEKGGHISIPYFTIDKNTNKQGMLNRQCTGEYKIEPVNTYVRRELLNLKPRQRAPKKHVVDQWYGISYDEIQRQKVPFTEPWRRNVYPLIERRIYRGQCLEWMEKNGYPQPPRSSCLCCPFHSNSEWLRIKNGDPDEWAELVKFDKKIRSNGDRGDLYLHKECKPLDEIDYEKLANTAQLSLLDECSGYCGV